MQVIPIATILLILVASVVTPVYAQGFSFGSSGIGLKITNIIEDIRLGLASQSDKIQLIKEFVNDKQSRIDNALSKGGAVPIDIEERRKDLVQKVESLSVGERIKQEFDRLGEMNEVRILYSQFPRCLEVCSEQDKEMFNDKVNSLESWKTRCSGEFDIDEYENTDDSFDKLSEKCPTLKQFSKNHLRSVVLGN